MDLCDQRRSRTNGEAIVCYINLLACHMQEFHKSHAHKDHLCGNADRLLPEHWHWTRIWNLHLEVSDPGLFCANCESDLQFVSLLTHHHILQTAHPGALEALRRMGNACCLMVFMVPDTPPSLYLRWWG